MAQGIQLKAENFIKNNCEPRGIKELEMPLTKKQKKNLMDNETLRNKCIYAYFNRIKKSKLYVEEQESDEDIKNNGFLFFNNILDKFDRKPYKGKISKYDEEGPNSPKSLEFYFYNYFCHRVQYMAMEKRKYVKDFNMLKPVDTLGQIMYDGEYTGDSTEIKEHECKYDITLEYLKRLEKETDEGYKSFLQDKFELGLSINELRERYGTDYYKYQAKCNKFKKELKEVGRETGFLKTDK
tara:strand:+ start:3805 stop:4521 length:717 start_codon:yes stop_codon:yes gene_type:complete